MDESLPSGTRMGRRRLAEASPSVHGRFPSSEADTEGNRHLVEQHVHPGDTAEQVNTSCGQAILHVTDSMMPPLPVMPGARS